MREERRVREEEKYREREQERNAIISALTLEPFRATSEETSRLSKLSKGVIG